MQYQEIDSTITKINPSLSAAEAHGMAVGMLCGNIGTENSFWLEEVLEDGGSISDQDKTALEDSFELTRSALIDSDYGFQLLLPDEESPLGQQLEALRNWCQGFLYGLGSCLQTADWSQESLEIVKDIAEFAHLDSNAEGEEAENDFMEITEYVRTAIIYLRTELNSGQIDTVH